MDSLTSVLHSTSRRLSKSTILSLLFVVVLFSSPFLSVVQGEKFDITYTLKMGGINPPANPVTYDNTVDTPILDAFDSVYEFMGWNVIYWANFSQVLTPQKNFVIPAGTYGRVELAAIFDRAPNDFPIYYDLDGGVNDVSNPVRYVGDKGNFPIVFCAPHKLGYLFVGWTVEFSDGVTANVTVPTSSVSIYQGTTGAVRLTAHWDGPIDYVITYVLGVSDVNGLGNPFTYNVTGLPIVIANASGPGHDFVRWVATFENRSSSTLVGSVISPGTTGDIVLRAAWDPAEIVEYKVYYYLFGTSSSVAASVTGYGAVDSNVTVNALSVPGYTVVGSGSITKTLDITNNVFIFYYTRNPGPMLNYSLTYDGNGHTGGNAPVDNYSPYVEGSLVTVASKGSLVKDNSVFIGWALSPTSNVIIYMEGSLFNIYSDTVLYAVWEPAPDTYTVIYRPGTHGIFGEQVTTALHYGDLTPVAPPVPAEGGWRFTGWLPTPSVTVTGDAIYVAQWEQITSDPDPETFVVRFVDWNDVVLKEEHVEYGKSATAPANPSRSGYTFTGWAPAFNNIVSNLTVKAQYTQNTPPTTTSKPTAPPSSTTKPSSSPPIATPRYDPGNTTPPPEPPTVEATWALVNLVLGVFGIILMVLVVVCAFLQKRRKQTHKETPVERKSVASQGAKYGNDTQNVTVTKKQKTINNLCLLTAVILGIVSIVVFFLTEDLSLKMGLVDGWTIVHAILFIVEIIVVFFYISIRKTSNKQKTQQNSNNSYTSRIS
ncbi:MAG: InlB B-repeat-containing protein [Nitrososphaerota archaeon]|nr:InlB B-repeat-containing protein [Nitrososphaerota archaeon]